MLRLFFQSIEQILGPWLSSFSTIVYWVGVFCLLGTALVPIWRQLMELTARRYSLERHWVMACPLCSKTTLVKSRTCGYCGEVLDIPFAVRLWSHLPPRIPSVMMQNIRWTVHMIVGLCFLAMAVILIVAVGGFQSRGELHRLFLGLSFLAMATLGWFGGQAVSWYPQGLFSRLRDSVIAVSSVGALVTFLFFAGQASPRAETVLARFSTEANSAVINSKPLLLPNSEIGFEYLQLDHEVLGFHRIVPLAFLGNDRLPINQGTIKDTVIHHLKTNPEPYRQRGLTIRFRIDQHHTIPGETYEVIEQDGQVLVRKTSGPLFIPDEE